MTAGCANCGHSWLDHLGDDGPCARCSCPGWQDYATRDRIAAMGGLWGLVGAWYALLAGHLVVALIVAAAAAAVLVPLARRLPRA